MFLTDIMNTVIRMCKHTRYASGVTDISEKHDNYLAKAFQAA